MEEAKKDNDNIPNDLKDMQKYYSLNKVFKEQAEGIVLPMFVKKITTSNIFDANGESNVPVTKKMLAEGFELSKADRNISFASPTAQAQMIDLSKTDEYTPKAFNLKEADLKEFRKYFNSLPKEGKQRQLAANLARAMHYDEIPEKDIKEFIFNVIKGFDSEQLSELNDNILETQGRIKEHINALLLSTKKRKIS